MRVVVMRCWLAIAVLIGLSSVASSQDYTFNVRVKLENISPDVDRFNVQCLVCKFATPTTGGCVLPGATGGLTLPTGATQLGGSAMDINLPASATPGGPKAYDGTVPLLLALDTGAVRSDVTNFSCFIALKKPDNTVAYLLSSPQDLPVWAKPDLNKPFTAIISGGL